MQNRRHPFKKPLPRADAGAMQLHLDHISRCVAGGAHAVITLDKAGWHTTRKLHVPSNISLMHLPPARPELNRPRTSGSTCANAISQIGSSATMTMSSKPPEISLSPNRAESHQSEREAGRQSVKVHEGWYQGNRVK
jgi:hypothetical protein